MNSLDAAAPNIRAILKKEQDRGNIIRVRIMHEVPQLQLEIQGSYLLMNPDDNAILSRRIHGKSGTLQPLLTGLKWGEEFPGLYQIKIIPTQSDTEIRLNGRPYTGNLTIYDVGNVLSVVNDLFVEDYVADLLTHSVSGEEPAEALAALAIAARSTAFYQAQHPRNPYWDIDGSTVGYPAPTDFALSPAAMTAAQQALRATRYMVLIDPTSVNDAFYAPWAIEAPPSEGNKKVALLTQKAAVEGANKGLHAAQILHATFPTAMLQRITPQ